MYYEQTSQLESALLQVGSTEELLCFFRENRLDFQMPRKTAIHYAKCLIQNLLKMQLQIKMKFPTKSRNPEMLICC